MAIIGAPDVSFAVRRAGAAMPAGGAVGVRSAPRVVFRWAMPSVPWAVERPPRTGGVSHALGRCRRGSAARPCAFSACASAGVFRRVALAEPDRGRSRPHRCTPRSGASWRGRRRSSTNSRPAAPRPGARSARRVCGRIGMLRPHPRGIARARAGRSGNTGNAPRSRYRMDESGECPAENYRWLRHDESAGSLSGRDGL